MFGVDSPYFKMPEGYEALGRHFGLQPQRPLVIAALLISAAKQEHIPYDPRA